MRSVVRPEVLRQGRESESCDDARVSGERYRALFEQAAVGIAMVGPDGRWIEVNRRLADIAGYSLEEMYELTFQDITHPEDLERDLNELKRLNEGEIDSYSMEKRYVRKDGSIKWINLTVGAVRDEAGDLQYYASVVEDIDDRKEAREKLKQQLQTTYSLLSASAAIAKWPDLERMLPAVAHAVLTSVAHSRVSVMLWDDEKHEGRIAASAGLNPFPEGMPVTRAMLSEPARNLHRDEADAEVVDYDGLPGDRRGAARDYGAHIALIVSIRQRGRFIGTIYVDDPGERRPFTDAEIDLVRGVSRQAGVAIENARLYEAQQQRRRRFEMLHGVMEVVVSSRDLRTGAQAMLDYMVAEHSFDLASIWIARDDALVLMGEVGYPDTYAERFSPMSLSAPYDPVSVYGSGVPVVVPDATRGDPAATALHEEMGVTLGAYLILPLLSRGHAIGTLHFGWSKPHEISAYDLHFYESLAGEVAVVLDNIELLEDRTVQAHYAEALNRIGSAIHSTLEFDEIMRRVVVEVAEALDVEMAAVHLRVDDHWEFRHAHNLPSEFLNVEVPDSEARLSTRVMRSREPIVVNDITTEPALDSEAMRRVGVTGLIGVPLIVRGQVLGVLFAGCLEGSADFHAAEVDFMSRAAGTLALALENARLYETEHDIADRLQGALLALPDAVPGIEFAHAYHSATDTARVGGDFYDLFEIDHNHVALVIGDVAGKGLEAAVLTSMVKNTLRAHANERGKTVAQILELTNDVIYKATPSEAFVTVFIGILDCRDGRLYYANAGHTAAALVEARGSARSLSVTGPLLGALPSVRYGMAESALGIDDALFLYTDGLTEARRAGQLYGEHRLFEFLASGHGGSAGALVQAVIDEVMEFSGRRLRDDLAILAVRRVRQGAETPAQQERVL